MVALPEMAKKLLQGKNFATVATLMQDGSPSASVVWVDTDGEHVIFNTAEGRVKPKSMKRDGRVAIAVYDQENPYRQAMIRGKVVSMETKGADAHIDKMAKKYMGVDSYPYRKPGEARIIVKIKPERVGLMGE
ncbi:MAG: PPOX class F420-dependent oxidoreductase [Alphaproteobacteria bacterium]|nr:PPOX class F420-dependent oxidoreductase [Alphaproteobacteria bacterium]